MMQSLTTRILLMTIEGITFDEACRWVLRRFPASLQRYYRLEIIDRLDLK